MSILILLSVGSENAVCLVNTLPVAALKSLPYTFLPEASLRFSSASLAFLVILSRSLSPIFPPLGNSLAMPSIIPLCRFAENVFICLLPLIALPTSFSEAPSSLAILSAIGAWLTTPCDFIDWISFAESAEFLANPWFRSDGMYITALENVLTLAVLVGFCAVVLVPFACSASSPVSYPGSFPEIIELITGAYLFAILAGITASPGASIAGNLSSLPKPGTERIPSLKPGTPSILNSAEVMPSLPLTFVCLMPALFSSSFSCFLTAGSLAMILLTSLNLNPPGVYDSM